MKIVFMGTPQFAVPSLKKLIEEGFHIAAAVTQPDARQGRGHRLSPPPVKTVAMEHGIPVLQFDKIKSPPGVQAIRDIAPDIIVTAAFGQILSREILDIQAMGCLNVHASLLPKYRGAAPIQWAIINGEQRSGVTIMYMDEGLDTGDIISFDETKIGNDMTGGELYDLLSKMGAQLLAETLHDIVNGRAKRIPQNEDAASYYPPLSKKMGAIDWNKSAQEIKNLVRALDPVMGACASVDGCVIKIWRAQTAQGCAAPGQIVAANEKEGLVVGTGSGLLRIVEMQAPGGRRMAAGEYLRGRALPGDRFS